MLIWDQFGMMLGSFWDHFGVFLVSQEDIPKKFPKCIPKVRSWAHLGRQSGAKLGPSWGKNLKTKVVGGFEVASKFLT